MTSFISRLALLLLLFAAGALDATASGRQSLILTPATATIATTTTLVAAPPVVGAGQSLALTATVRRTGTSGNATGAVTFLYGSAALGTVTLSDGAATLKVATAGLPSGVYDVTASYAGDAEDGGSKSGTVAVTIKSAATVTFMSSPYSVPIGTDVTFTAKVAGLQGAATPTGTVSFLVGGALLTTVPLSAGAGVGTASFVAPTTGVPGGLYGLTASYSGDAVYAPASSVSATVAAEVAKDCGTSTCAVLTLAGDLPQAGTGFHGYADPSMRKDPNSALIYLAYSWPHTVSAANTNAIDLHLSHSADGGSTWNYDGPLFVSEPVTNTMSTAYATDNVSSFEVIDLLPVAIDTATYWVQAHRQYYVANGTKGGLYGQAPVTGVIALSILGVNDPGKNPSELLGLGTAPQTILGTATTDATIPINVNLASLDPDVAGCQDYDQPALAFENGTLYLAVECEDAHLYDTDDLAFPVFSTVPDSTDPRVWKWKYEGTIATLAEAVALGTEEGMPYQFMTELEFVHGVDGQLLALMTPSVLTESGQQPVIQHGCRFVPVTTLSPPTLQLDPNGAPLSVASVEDSSLYEAPNEGPGACTYEPASSTGVVIVHKLEDDKAEGFYPTLESSGTKP